MFPAVVAIAISIFVAMTMVVEIVGEGLIAGSPVEFCDLQVFAAACVLKHHVCIAKEIVVIPRNGWLP